MRRATLQVRVTGEDAGTIIARLGTLEHYLSKYSEFASVVGFELSQYDELPPIGVAIESKAEAEAEAEPAPKATRTRKAKAAEPTPEPVEEVEPEEDFTALLGTPDTPPSAVKSYSRDDVRIALSGLGSSKGVVAVRAVLQSLGLTNAMEITEDRFPLAMQRIAEESAK